MMMIVYAAITSMCNDVVVADDTLNMEKILANAFNEFHKFNDQIQWFPRSCWFTVEIHKYIKEPSKQKIDFYHHRTGFQASKNVFIEQNFISSLETIYN